MGEDLQHQYVQALITEMRQARTTTPKHHSCKPVAANIRNTPISTIYIGGGTPTALPSPLLCEILQEAQQFNLSSDTEITLEMNPCTNPHSALSDFKNHGVNRLSIGLQAWQNDLLAALKRAHTSNDFTQTIQAARAAGINNINVDLMFALPGQTMEHWQESIAQVITHAPEHIYVYSLTPAENTPLWDELESGKIKLPDESIDRAMYHKAIKMFAAAGYQHYELSNFAKPGRESRHNIDCWRRKPYRGFGLGAHSFDGTARWRNTFDIEKYLAYNDMGEPLREDLEILYQRDAMAEMMFLGLRMTKGVSQQDFLNTFGKTLTDCYGKELDILISRGLLAHSGEMVALTPRGLDLANQVFEMFL